MNILKSLGIKSHKQKIVERLLQVGQITAAEAVELLNKKEHVHIHIESLSSGARLIIGEDNTVDSHIR